MKKIITLLLITVLISSCKEQIPDIDYVSHKFYDNINKIEKVQYEIQNIITFSNGTVWDNKGLALLEKNEKDTILGFSFYGIRNDLNKSAIYQDEIGFQVSNDKKSFKQEKGGLHFLGNPGGQMVYKDFFKLDTVYKSVEVLETKNSFIINYSFNDEVENNTTDKEKSLELDKTTFLPIKVTTSLQPDFGTKQTIEYIFNNLKINENVDKSIADYKLELNKFELIENEKTAPNKLLNKPLPLISLTNLLNENETIALKNGKITLIDFWEVWCGWCIKSFSEVENLKNKYSNDLNVIGIVTQDKENAIKLTQKKKITFLNLLGTKETLKEFSVNSFPRYFLVNKDGIIEKEYFGFSDQIEKDIIDLITD